MKVFVTGATGFIGSAVVQELLSRNHEVLALARSESSASSLTSLNNPSISILRGGLTDLDVLKTGASTTDATIHLAFNHDFSKYEQNAKDELESLRAITSVLIGTKKPLIWTTGTLGQAANAGKVALEDDPTPSAEWNPRGPASEFMDGLAKEDKINASVIRLPPTNHGKGDKGFIDILINMALEKGVSAYVGNGENRWPANHRLDTASVYVLAMEYAVKKPGCYTWHAVAEEGVPVKEIVGLIGEKLGLKTESVPMEKAQEHFGWFGMVIAADNPSSSEKTRKELGWTPKQKGLLEDMKDGHYFEGKEKK